MAGDSPRRWPRCLNVQDAVLLLPQNNSLEQQNSSWCGLEEDRNTLEVKVASPPSRAALLFPPLPPWCPHCPLGGPSMAGVQPS